MVEYLSQSGKPITRGGILYADKTTENDLALHLVGKAFSILTKTCCVVVFTECGHILRTMQNHWLWQWQKNGWVNAKGKMVRNAEAWNKCADLIEKHVTEWKDAEHAYRKCMQGRIRKEMELEHEPPAEGIYVDVPVPEWNTR